MEHLQNHPESTHAFLLHQPHNSVPLTWPCTAALDAAQGSTAALGGPLGARLLQESHQNAAELSFPAPQAKNKNEVG